MNSKSSLRKKHCALLALSVATLALSCGANAGLVSVSHTDMDVDWTQDSAAHFPTSRETSSARATGNGSYPDAYREVTIVVFGTNHRIEVFDAKAGDIYDPYAQGAMLSLDFTMDHR
jgi:hypothetical protein